MKTSELLREAADRNLWNGEGAYVYQSGACRYSCDAVQAAYRRLTGRSYATLPLKVKMFLCELGVGTRSLIEFDDVLPGPQRQGARYAWLMFAADIADEWGVE